jgi:hypothetical protein
VTEERLKKVGRFTRVKTEGYGYDLPEEARAELGFAVLDTAVVIAEVLCGLRRRLMRYGARPSNFRRTLERVPEELGSC